METKKELTAMQKIDKANEQVKELFEKSVLDLSCDLFMNYCTACGGNWVAMLWSGIKNLHEHEELTDEEFKKLEEIVDSVAGNGGVPQFAVINEASHWIMARLSLGMLKIEMDKAKEDK